MPIGLGVASWRGGGAAVRQCGAIARTYRSGNVGAPQSRQIAGSGAISTMDRCTGGVTAYACGLWTLWTQPTRRIVKTQTRPVTRSPHLDTAPSSSRRSGRSLCRDGGATVRSQRANFGLSTRLSPRHVSTPGSALFRQTAASTGLRRVLAFRGRYDCVRLSKRKLHPSRVSL